MGARDEERVGYGLQQGNYDRALALVYAKQNPSPEVSRALFNADTLGEQMIHLAKPTTGQLSARSAENGQWQLNAELASDQQKPSDAKRGTEPLNGSNQVAQAATMPQEAQQVVQELGNALQRTQQQVASMQN